MEEVEVIEHADIDISIDRLLIDGELALDARIATRGYLEIAIAKGKLRIRASRYVGRIPLTENLVLFVRPKASIANLSQMVVRSGQVPTIIEGFARGYKPLFEQSEKAIELYYPSYLKACEQIVKQGLLKRYVRVENPPKWRGRLLLAQTINRHVARGVRYNPLFDFTTLSTDVIENRLIKTALLEIVSWLDRRPEVAHKRKLREGRALLSAFESVSSLKTPYWNAVAQVPRLARFLLPHMLQYREALWAAYAILQRAIPDIVHSGYVSLESMIVDVSSLFENYTRAVISDRAAEWGLSVKDGNKLPRPFFTIGNGSPTKPDIIIEGEGVTRAVLDVKYKATIHEQDRYELLAFLEATGAKYGAFICPKMSDADQSGLLGTTLGGRTMGIIRFDLATQDMSVEEDRMFECAMRVVRGDFSF